MPGRRDIHAKGGPTRPTGRRGKAVHLLATAMLASAVSLCAYASTHRWIVESPPPVEASGDAGWMAGAASLLVRSKLAEGKGLSVLAREDVRPDVATLELTRLSSAKGPTRVMLGKYARSQGLIEVDIAGGAKATLSLRAIDLRQGGREKTFSATVAPGTLQAEVARLTIEAATFLGQELTEPERARMTRQAFANPQALRAAAEGAAESDASAAVASLTRSVGLDPSSALGWYLLARRQHEAGKLPAAITAYRRAISLDGDATDFHYDLGNAFFDDKRYAEAAEEYRRAITLDACHASSHENLLRALRAQGLKPADVLAKYDEATASWGDVAVTQTQRGVLLNALGRTREALSAFQKSAALSPDDPIVHFNLAHALDGQKRTDEAIGEYTRAIDLAPNYAKAHNNLGFLYERQGKEGTALFHYQQATKFAPDYARGWNNLAILYGKRHRLPLAIDAYEHVVKLTPDDPIAYYNLGIAHHENGDIAAAIDAYKKALSLKEDDKLTHWHLAAAYERSGLWNLANRHWKRVLELEPTEEERGTAERHVRENEKR